MSDDVLFHRVRVRLDEPALDDVAGATDRTLADCGVALEPGGEVAITIGSRGIGDLTTVVGRIVAWVRAQGAVAVPRPGDGQPRRRHRRGPARGARGVRLRRRLGGLRGALVDGRRRRSPATHDLPVPIVTDAHAAAAAATIVVNRVKQHTDFHGPYESGLMKMTAIGLGKRVAGRGAARPRHAGPARADAARRRARARPRQRRARRRASSSNALDRDDGSCGPCRPRDIADGRAGPARRWPGRTPARLPVDDLDVLLIDRMGKDISGVGIDTNVIGRTMITGEPDPPSAAHPDDRLPRADPGVARQRHRHGPGRRRHPPPRRRHRPRGDADEHRDVRASCCAASSRSSPTTTATPGSCACAAPA